MKKPYKFQIDGREDLEALIFALRNVIYELPQKNIREMLSVECDLKAEFYI